MVHKVAISQGYSGGFIALTAVLILSAVILVVSVGASLRSIDGANMSLSHQESHRALSYATLCAENAMQKLVNIFEYSGNETMTVGGEACDILTIEGTGNQNRTIKTQSTIMSYTRRIVVEVSQISPVFLVNSWRMPADF